MPDPDRRSVSGTQAAALFGQSPYATAFTVFHYLKTGISDSVADNIRTKLGKMLQGPILSLVAEELRLEVINNAEDRYVRHPAVPVGATVDGRVTCPTRGRGIVQVKVVGADQQHLWRDKLAPAHIEIQVQTEMIADEAEWGLIAALIGGTELMLLERRPVASWRTLIIAAAEEMMGRVERDDPPPAFGMECELAVIAELWPEVKRNKVIESEDEALAEDARRFLAANTARKLAEEERTASLVRLRAALQDADCILLPGVYVAQRQDKNGRVTITAKERGERQAA